MKIKTKLTLGVGLLFAMIVLLTTMSVYYINKLSVDSKNILADNYNSIEYCRHMLNGLNKGIHLPEVQNSFSEHLALQKQTVTEIGEQELTDRLENDFNKISQGNSDPPSSSVLRSDIMDIMLLNMQALQRKSIIAQETADNAILWISIMGTFCFFLAFVMLVNLPGNIANPIRELSTSIKQIAAQNYSQRVHFEHHNEFGELSSSFNTMAEKLEEFSNSHLAKLMIEKRRIETLINNMHDPVIGLDENHRIIFINNEALKITGLNLKDVFGISVQDVAIHNDLVRSLIQNLGGHNNANDTKKLPLKIYADNKESYFEKEIIPIKIVPTGEKSEIQIGTVVLLQNITPYKELDFAKTNFIATVSHELKTPIASIKMSLDLLDNSKIGSVNSEQKQLIQSVREDSERLLKITSELLDMTQVESGKIQLSFKSVMPQDIIRYAIEAVKIQAEQKNITIDINHPPLSSHVYADPDKTAWVLVNLLSNAIRHSHDNTRVCLSVHDGTDKVLIAVQDFGKGIDSKYQSRIFDRYYLVPEANPSGTGLGLAICKEFIEAQGGEISMSSEIGKGSTFSITLNKTSG